MIPSQKGEVIPAPVSLILTWMNLYTMIFFSFSVTEDEKWSLGGKQKYIHLSVYINWFLVIKYSHDH